MDKHKYVMAYTCLFSGETELIIIYSHSAEDALVQGLESKGWEARTQFDRGSITDASWSLPKRVDEL